MKLYQAIRLEQKISNEVLELNIKFNKNNSVFINESRSYDPKTLFSEIIKKKEELVNLKFQIERTLLNIKELKLQNEEYLDVIETLKNTCTSLNTNYNNRYTRLELDKMIEEYQDKIYKNNETIEYFNFVTDVTL